MLVGEPLEPMYPLAEAERIRKRELHQRANLQRLLLAFDWLYDRIVEPAPVADVAWDDGDARYADLLRYLDEVMPEPAKIGQAGFRILEGTYAYRLEKGEFRGNFVPGAPPLEFGRHDARHALRTEYTNPVPELFRTSTMLPQGGMGGVLYAYTGQVHLQPLLMPPHMS